MANNSGKRGAQRGHGHMASSAQALERLLNTLRRPGDAEANYPLIVRHAHALIACAPERSGARAWMLQQLPEQWHRERVTSALESAVGGASH